MGKIIVIEGLDGSGKATQTKLLFEKLRQPLNDSRSERRSFTVQLPLPASPASLQQPASKPKR